MPERDFEIKPDADKREEVVKVARKGLADLLQQYGLLDQGEAIVRGSGTDATKADELTRLLKDAGAPETIIVSNLQVFRWRQALGAAAPVRESIKEPAVANEPKSRGAPKGNRNAAGHGAPAGNSNALATGEYARLWAPGLTPAELSAIEEVGAVPTVSLIDRQIGLIDVRIGRMMIMIRQTRVALAAGVELQLDSRTESDKVKTGDEGELTIAGGDTITATNVLVHTREILERQESALDRMLQRREKLLTLKVQRELRIKPDDPGEGNGDTVQEHKERVRRVLENKGAREAVRDLVRQAMRNKDGL